MAFKQPNAPKLVALFYERLEACAKARDWTLYQLALQIGADNAYFYKARCRSGLPGYTLLRDICKTLDCSPHFLLGMDRDDI